MHYAPEIKYEGYFDLDKIGKYIKEWMFNEEFDYDEPKFKQSASTFGEEYEIKFVGHKPIDEYFEIKIIVDLHTWDSEPVEAVLKDGTKKKMLSGRMKINFGYDIVFDWQGKWKGPFLSRLRHFYDNHIINKWFDFFWDSVYYLMYDLHTQIKNLLNMETAYDAYKFYR